MVTDLTADLLDPLMSEVRKSNSSAGEVADLQCLVYQLKPGTTTAGSPDSISAQIKLSGSHILPEHCTFTNDSTIVSVTAAEDARMFVNGKRIPANTPVKLLNGFRVILGDFHVFRFNDPAAVRKERQQMATSASMEAMSAELSGVRPDSSAGGAGEMMDWNAARREMADIEKLGDQDLDKLFDDIVSCRMPW
jgi:kinesin family protein 1